MLRATARGLLLALAFACPAVPALAECGIASWYDDSGRLTASGEYFVPDGITAAHKTLPFGSRVIVRNQRTGRAVLVRINDRGPFVAGRVIDLSRGAKRVLGMDGLAAVCLDVISLGSGRTGRKRADFETDIRTLFGRAGQVAAGIRSRVVRQFRPRKHRRRHSR